MRSWNGQMTAKQSRIYAESLVLPAMLPVMNITGQIKTIEGGSERLAIALDILGGIDFWIRTPDGRLVSIASRNQWHRDDGHKRESFTVRVDIGGPKTEAHKRVRAIKDGGIVPDWTVQGYITANGLLHHAGAIHTRELFVAFIEAAHKPDFKTWNNPADGHEFWAGFWQSLRKYGHADTLCTIGAAPVMVAPAESQARLDEFCDSCKSHFCPHAAPHPYRPPFTRRDELAQALVAWEARWPAR
jgi:hypothetical protein